MGQRGRLAMRRRGPTGAMVPIDGNSASWSRLDANAVTTCTTGAV